jgi:hypothetical protein
VRTVTRNRAVLNHALIARVEFPYRGCGADANVEIRVFQGLREGWKSSSRRGSEFTQGSGRRPRLRLFAFESFDETGHGCLGLGTDPF